jgi:hypothetical protein
MSLHAITFTRASGRMTVALSNSEPGGRRRHQVSSFYNGKRDKTGTVRRVERAALVLASIGTAMVWIVPYLLSSKTFPDWIASRWYLLVCLPATLLGVGAYRRYAAFARTPAVLASAGLMAVGIVWTDPTEVGRGALLAAAFLITLPIGALIRKHDYLKTVLYAFSTTTGASLLFAFVIGGTSFQRGTLVDLSRTAITNPNAIGIQAALAALFVSFVSVGRRRPHLYLRAALVAVLVVASIWTASRTAFIALAAAFVVSIVFGNKRSAPISLVAIVIVAICSLVLNTGVDPEHRFYRGIVSRLLDDDEGTRDTLGNRTVIWRSGIEEFTNGNVWLYGTGTGGVDKVLGTRFEIGDRQKGRDGIWRLYAHNTIVWCGLAFGLIGLVVYIWLGIHVARSAYSLDKKQGECRRSTLVVFVLIAGSGGVITQECYWCILGAVLWTMLSVDVPTPGRRPRWPLTALRPWQAVALRSRETESYQR